MILSIFFIVLSILSIYSFIIEFYYLFLSIFGFKKLKKKYYDDYNPEAKFLILVAAHNEEAVIGSTIENLNKIEYPKDLYHLCIVNDNSTDKTGVICSQLKIKHIHTNENLYPKEGVGKSAGLQYALRYLGFENLKNTYDLLLILDADNHVDSNILAEINSQWISEGKPTAIQTYLDSKNSKSSIATGYTISYNIMNRFFQLSKNRLGLNNAIGGTGFVVRMDWLINTNGFSYKSLVEDLEMSINIFKTGGKVSWNHFTRIYDEKPDTFKVSMKQRIRWCQGHWYVAFTNFFLLVKKLLFEDLKTKIRAFDQLIYLFSMGKALQMGILLLSIIVTVILTIFSIQYSSICTSLIKWVVPINGLRLLLALYSYVFLPIYANRIDGSFKIHPLKLIWGILYVGNTYIFAQIIGLFKCKNQSTWIKTPHKHIVSEKQEQIN